MTTESTTYQAIITASPLIPNDINKGTQVIRNTYLISFPFQPHVLNFRANIGISATRSQQLINTPANALFWGSLIVGLGDQIATWPYAFWLILLGTFISSYLLVSEIPMFALKFKTWGWKGNEIKYVFLITCIPLLILMDISGLAVIIAWYVVLSIVNNSQQKK